MWNSTLCCSFRQFLISSSASLKRSTILAFVSASFCLRRVRASLTNSVRPSVLINATSISTASAESPKHQYEIHPTRPRRVWCKEPSVPFVVEDWRQLSGEVELTYDNWRQADVRADENSFFYFFMAGVHFLGEKKGEKKFLWKQGHSEVAEAQYMSTIHRWWDTQSKQTRQTYRQSIQSTPRQFTKIWKRITTPRQHATQKLRNIRVKLNGEVHMWSLFITTINKYCMYTASYMSLQSCMWGAKTNTLIHIHIYWGDIYGYIYIHLYTYIYIHTHTHTHRYC